MATKLRVNSRAVTYSHNYETLEQLNWIMENSMQIGKSALIAHLIEKEYHRIKELLES